MSWLLLGMALMPLAPARPVTLPDVSGKTTTVPDAHARATVLLFIAHDCPIANGYAPEIQRIAAAYAPRGLAFDLVYVDPGFSAAQARAHEAAYGYHLPALRDTAHILIRMTGAVVTPEAAVLAPDGRLLYRGRIDNKYPALGVQRTVITRHDLCAALDAILSARPVAAKMTQAIGCSIPPLSRAGGGPNADRH